LVEVDRLALVVEAGELLLVVARGEEDAEVDEPGTVERLSDEGAVLPYVEAVPLEARWGLELGLVERGRGARHPSRAARARLAALDGGLDRVEEVLRGRVVVTPSLRVRAEGAPEALLAHHAADLVHDGRRARIRVPTIGIAAPEAPRRRHDRVEVVRG